MLLKGMGIGLAVILPGMSAGTAALVFGCYDWLISGVKRLDFLGLWPVLAGTALGILLGARVITRLLAAAPSIILSFLLGLILMSAVYVLNNTGPVTWQKAFIGLVSLSAAWLLAASSINPALTPEAVLFACFVSGMLSAAAMVLPGVSGSSVLVVIGQYERMLGAIVEWDWLLLAFFLVGAAIGIYGFAHIISALLRYFPKHTMVALSGLMLGATKALFPGQFGVTELVALAGGAFLVALFRQ
jgi:putative membrane protein